MGFFRSEPMTLCQILLHHESAFNCLVELGQLGKVQLRHIYEDDAICNNRYNADIQRCNELQHIITSLETDLRDSGIRMTYYPDVDVEDVPQASDLKEAEKHLEMFHQKVGDVKQNIDGLKRRRNYLFERKQVLLKADQFLTGARNTEPVLAWSSSVIMNLMHDEIMSESADKMQIGFFTGTIAVQRYAAFERMVYRITRGNYFLRHEDITFPQQDMNNSRQQFYKYVFMLFFTGQSIREKLSKVCQGFGIRLFECPESGEERKVTVANINQDIADLDVIIKESERQRDNFLLIVASDLYVWKVNVKKALMVYYVMNRMKRVKRLQIEKYLQTECWVPKKYLKDVREALRTGADRTAKDDTVSMFPPMLLELSRKQITDEETPTLFTLNRFTRGFQNLIDAYGVATYREINPAPYTTITFPFLFAVMFGDVGHGLIMAIFGLFMIIREKHFEEENRRSAQSSEIWNLMFSGRYIIFLMGVFSVYTGLIYNDVFSKAFNIFGSKWHPTRNITLNMKGLHFYQLDPAKNYEGDPYWFGVDPVWDASGENAITTFNSMKMKMAVILGVIQMIFGLILSACNQILRKQYYEFYLVFVPQITFLMCIFFYLVFMIFFKWVNFGGHYNAPYNSACAPSILIIFINMLLMKSAEKPPEGCMTWMYKGQHIIQACLLYTALLSVPILLAGRPLYIMYNQKKLRKLKNDEAVLNAKRSTVASIRRTLVYNVDNSLETLRMSRKAPSGVLEPEPEKQDIAELWIHSGIHCIESVLGSVSHTASYLRLWALSLAHDQLSTVLWNMVLKIGLTGKRGYWNSLVLFVVFIFWAVLTIAILVVMEGLSAFLHTLRLHWVEFQSKFYAGAGSKFTPFAFPESTVSG